MYHITPKGEPGVCQAQHGNCPYGSLEEHFTSANQARYAYEQKMGMSSQATAPLRKRPTLALPSDEAPDDLTFNQKERSIEYTPASVREKFERDIAGHSYELLSPRNAGEPGLILERLYGREPDSDPGADLGTVELKTLKSSRIDQNISLGKVGMEGDVASLRRALFADRFNAELQAGEWSSVGGHYYSLLVDRKQRKVRLVIANSSKQIISADDFGWSFDALEHKVDIKLHDIAVGLYETEEKPDGHRMVTFEKIVMGGFTRQSFIDKLESGEVTVAFDFCEGTLFGNYLQIEACELQRSF